MIPGILSPSADGTNNRRRFEAASPESGIVMLEAAAPGASSSMFSPGYPSHLPLQANTNANSIGTAETRTSAFTSTTAGVAGSTTAAAAGSESLSTSLLINPQDDLAAETGERDENDSSGNVLQRRNSSPLDVGDDDETWESDLQTNSDPNLSDPNMMFGGSSQNVFRSRNKSPDHIDGSSSNVNHDVNSAGDNLLPPYHRRRRFGSHGSGSKKKRHHHRHRQHHRSRRRAESTDSYQDDVADTGHSSISDFFSTATGNDKFSTSPPHSGHARRDSHKGLETFNDETNSTASGGGGGKKTFCYCCDRTIVRSTLSFMNLLARILVWSSVVALAAAVVWYSLELTKHG